MKFTVTFITFGSLYYSQCNIVLDFLRLKLEYVFE